MKYYLPLFILLISNICLGQKASFRFNDKACTKLQAWFNGDMNDKELKALTLIPGLQLSEELFKSHTEEDLSLLQALHNFKADPSKDDTEGYGISRSFSLKDSLALFQKELLQNNYQKEVYTEAIRYLPNNFKPQKPYECFLTLVGWKWGDAMQFSYNINDGKYSLAYENGTPAMMYNLKSMFEFYGKNNTSRMETLKRVMSHELFHALFDEYTTKEWEKKDRNFNQEVLILMLNEGIAHYVAERKRMKDISTDTLLRSRISNNFSILNKQSDVLFDSKADKDIRKKTAMSGLSGNYWEKYICICGMFMAKNIEDEMGIEALRSCVTNGPKTFISLYQQTKAGKTNDFTLPSSLLMAAKEY